MTSRQKGPAAHSCGAILLIENRMGPLPRTVVWRRILDEKSFELMSLSRAGDAYQFHGTVLAVEGDVIRLVGQRHNQQYSCDDSRLGPVLPSAVRILIQPFGFVVFGVAPQLLWTQSMPGPVASRYVLPQISRRSPARTLEMGAGTLSPAASYPAAKTLSTAMS